MKISTLLAPWMFAVCVVAGNASANTIDVTISAMTDTIFQAELVNDAGDFPEGTKLEGTVWHSSDRGQLCVEQIITKSYNVRAKPNECYAIGRIPLVMLPYGGIEILNDRPDQIFELSVVRGFEAEMGFGSEDRCLITYLDGPSEIVSRRRLSDILNGWSEQSTPSHFQIECPYQHRSPGFDIQ